MFILIEISTRERRCETITMGLVTVGWLWVLNHNIQQWSRFSWYSTTDKTIVFHGIFMTIKTFTLTEQGYYCSCLLKKKRSSNNKDESLYIVCAEHIALWLSIFFSSTVYMRAMLACGCVYKKKNKIFFAKTFLNTNYVFTKLEIFGSEVT